jgi:protein involved in polysaccharide export with SLBB domain
MRTGRSLLIPFAAVGAIAAMLVASPATGQSAADWDPQRAEVTRDDLTALLARLEAAGAAAGYSPRLREQARQEADHVRARLEQGDFQVGDRVVLEIRGEPDMSDTLAVTAGRQIEIAQVGPVSLAGVLRSELEVHLARELARYIQNPSVRATALVRVGVMGAVARQGFYTVPATMLLEELIMHAGGPAGRADLRRLAIQRGDRTVLNGEPLQRAMAEGRTLDQLSLRAGDRLMLPERGPGFFEGGVLRTLIVTVPALAAILLQVL